MKAKTIYVCQKCGAQSARWVGRCHSCGTWGSFVEEIIVPASDKKSELGPVQVSEVVKLSQVSSEAQHRFKTGIAELDRVLGGGIVAGSIILVGGDPGIGKSTLMLQMCGGLTTYLPLFITGEESLEQIKYRSTRIRGIPENLSLLAETNIEVINNTIKGTKCGIVVIDSIQSMYSDRIESTPGSISQVRECASLLMQTAKKTNRSIFLVGHVTKEGIIAGPKVLEHMVDTVLHFEGEKNHAYRILRAVKNRFGSTNELGIFEMAEDGLSEVTNPSELFLAHRMHEDTGIAIVAAIEGTRPILIEVQALVTPSGYSVPQRIANGFDLRRLNLLLAVLEKRLGERFRQHDVFVNVAGGIYLNDPAVDLGMAAALVSSLRDAPIDMKTVLIGEIGLTGEVRGVSAIEKRINEAQKLGFSKVIIPSTNHNKAAIAKNIDLMPVERISLALSQIFPV